MLVFNFALGGGGYLGLDGTRVNVSNNDCFWRVQC